MQCFFTSWKNLNCQVHQDMKLKPGLPIVETIPEHACDHVLKRVLKLLIYRLKIFLANVKYEYLRSLQLCEEDQGIPGKFNP